jgi:hypothetical protein
MAHSWTMHPPLSSSLHVVPLFDEDLRRGERGFRAQKVLINKMKEDILG